MTHPLEGCLDPFSQPVHEAQPGQAAEQAEAGRHQRQQQQGRAGKAQPARQRLAQHLTEHAAVHQRQ